jgi:hypothetical protein
MIFLQIKRYQIQEHCLSETHQRVLLSILIQLQSKKKALLPIDNTISTISNDVVLTEDSILQIENEFCSRQNSLQTHIEEFASVTERDRENEHCLNIMEAIYRLSDEDIQSLKQRLENGSIIYFDGSLTWKISDIEEKLSTYEE